MERTIDQLRKEFFSMCHTPKFKGSSWYRVNAKWIDNVSQPYVGDETRRVILTAVESLVFTSLKAALDCKDEFLEISSRMEDKRLYEIIVEEYPDGSSFYHDGSIRSWLYGPDGELLDSTVNEYWGYYGMPEGSRRFKIGDIVEVMGCEELKIGIVADMPLTPEQAWNDAYQLSTMSHNEESFIESLNPADNGYTVLLCDDDYEVETCHPFNIRTYDKCSDNQKKMFSHLLSVYHSSRKV